MKKLISLVAFLIVFSKSSYSIDSYTQETEDELTTVLTPIRLEQHRKNVPAGVTVITAKKLKNLGISSLPEAMRLVPGMRINQASGWDYRINFHGTNALVPRRMLVLVDGMSVFRYGFSQVDWNRLAVDIEDIERIEVTRSPSTTSYGTNAFQVVVNIITKHPNDVENISIVTEYGTENFERNYGRFSGTLGNTAYLVSFASRSDDGFDEVSFDKPREAAPGAEDSQEVDNFLVRSETIFSIKNKLELRLGGVKADLEEEQVDPEQLAPPEKKQNDWHAHASYSHIASSRHHIKIHTYFRESKYTERWDLCRPAALFLTELRELALVNSGLALEVLNGNAPVGSNAIENELIQSAQLKIQGLGAEVFRPLCGSANNDIEESSLVFEVEDIFQPFDHTRINSSIGYRDNEANSETFFNGKVGSQHFHIQSNAEILLSNSWTLNAGFIYEDVSNVDETIFDLRAGLNYHYTDTNTVRFVYSSASRLPNILSTDRDWNYYMRNWDREFDGRTEGYLFLNTTGPDNLQPEEIESIELGFFGTTNKYTYDAKFFNDQLRSLISEKGTFFDFNLTNNSEVDLIGFESEIAYKLSPYLEFSGGYSYIDTKYTNFFEQTAHSTHAGFASLTRYSNLGAFSLAYFGNSQISGESYGRWDVSYLNHYNVSESSELEVRLLASYLTHDETAYQFENDNRAIHRYDDNWQLRIQATLSY